MADRKKPEKNRPVNIRGAREHGMIRDPQVIDTNSCIPLSSNVVSHPEQASSTYSKDIELIFGPEVLKDNYPRTPDELCSLLVSKKSFFENVLSLSEIFKDKFHSIWFLVANCCQCENGNAVHDIVKTVNESEEFVHNGLLKFLVKVQNASSQEEVGTLCHITTYLEKLTEHCSHLAMPSLSLILPFLEDSVKANATFLGEKVLSRVENLEKTLMNLKGRPEVQLNWSQIDNSEESFRNMLPLPDMKEIIFPDRAIFYSQDMERSYHDVEQYLSRQFRLIRGEMLKLIHEKVSLCKNYLEKGAGELLHEISSHTNVRITNILVSEDGVLHEIQFPCGNTLINPIPWEYSKYFTAGSLLCFTCNSFRTVLFATVVGHDPILLDQKKLYVRFEPETLTGVYSDNKQEYVVTEIGVHAEVCFRILSNLQTISSNFPFDQIISNLQKKTEPPLYASDKSLAYCFETVRLRNSETESMDKKEIQSTDACGCEGKRIVIHNLSDWAELDCGLDESQKYALRTALTQNVTIIQGSPGTGKTHLALKLTKILLHNRHAWAKPNEKCPIVILTHSSICLDTFLEGVLEITRNVTRVGGKSQSDQLVNYNLKRKSTFADTQSRIKVKREVAVKLKEISKMISDIENRKKNIKCELLSVEELGKVISRNDIERLQVNCPPDLPSPVDMDTLLRVWLDFDNLRQNKDRMAQESTFRNVSCVSEIKGTNAEREIEYLKDVRDAIFIHNERSIEGEFQDLTAVFVNETYDKPQKQSAHDKLTYSDQREIENICQRLNVVPMTTAQSAFCTDLWNLSLENRWGLYSFWVSKCDEKFDTEIKTCRVTFEENLSNLKAITETRVSEVLSDNEVVGLTVTGAAKYTEFIKRLKPKIIIIEEAEKILDSQIFLLLNEETEHLILIGDQNLSGLIGTLFDLGETSSVLPSLFQRLYQSGFPHCRLSVQYNPRPCESQLQLSAKFGKSAAQARVLKDESIKGLEKNVFFLTHSSVETRSKDGRCHINDYEVSFIVELCRYILLQGYSSSSIAILTPNLAQFFKLRKRMTVNLRDVKVSLSDNLQEDSDIILVTFTRSETGLENSSSAEEKLLYTALSRARKGLYSVGNFEAFAKKNNFWKGLCENLKEIGCFGQELNILCQSHGNIVVIKSLTDLFRLGDGGCGQPCRYRMTCGHECPRKCHPNDREHKNMKCMEPCQTTPCNNNHKCLKLCWEKCGNCLEMLDNVILRCGHSKPFPCFRLTLDQRSHWEVPYKVENSLYGKEDIKLAFAVKLSVGNNGDICFPSLEQECDVLCGKQLQCGHQCKGRCGECMGGRIHVPCLEVCGKVQVCGHTCLYPCSSPCPPCSFQYEQTCSHTRWTVFCGFPTTPCLKPCEWTCEHFKCSRLCHEPCDRPPCNENCKKVLKCGHNCIGMCGEICPDKCRFCDQQEVTSLCFGKENDPRARFVQLKDCGHIFEIIGLTFWITNQYSTNSAFGLIKCPTCNKPIFKDQIFGNLIKHQTKLIEDLKSKKYQMMCNISEVKGMLSTVKEELNMLSKRNMTCERFWSVDQPCTDPCSILETLYARFLLKYNPIDQGMFALFCNYYTFVLENYKIASKMGKLQELIGLLPVGNASRRAIDFIGSTLEAINERILYFWDFGSAQFVEEIASELRRLHLACNFIIIYQNFFGFDDAYIQSKLGDALNIVLQDFPFRKHEEWLFNLVLEEIQNVCPGVPVLATISEPPIPIMEAMDLREGKSLWSRMDMRCETSADVSGGL